MFKLVKSVLRCLKWTKVNLFFLLFILCNYVCQSHEPVYLNHIAVHIKGGHEEANRVARSTGLINKGQVGSLNDHYVFEIPGHQRRSARHSQEHHEALTGHSQVHWFEQQIVKTRVKRDFQQPPHSMKLVDPDWPNQWYLHNGAYGKFDMNVIPAWQRGYTGKGVVITILDDGIERTHTDLRDNYDPWASYDVNSHDNDPMPRYDPTDENRHGTRCAGEVSAKANNTKCSVGVAYNSRIGGVRMLDGEVYDVVEATSLSFNRSHIDIYSASWGPDDDGRVVDGPGPLAKKAFIDGIQQGRNGKGSIFVWASGNGGAAHDSCNCDGYTNSIYTLSISSTSERGTKPWYLEECSSTLATTYSSGAYNEKKIVTDDLHDGCTSTHTGTSASAPLAAGIVALALEANPGLTWRDVQYITLMAARPEPMNDGQWVVNGLGRKVSLRYGYGLMDGAKMVDLALRWTNVPEQHICEIPSSQQNVELKGGKVVLKIRTNGCQGTNKEVKYLEHVQAKISLTYQRRGDIILHLTSPNGTKSTMLPRRPNDRMAGSFSNWAFLSVHFWGESVAGEWTLEIEDGSSYRSQSSQRGGTLQHWSLVFHGTSVQPVNLRNPNATAPPPIQSTTASTQSWTTTFPEHWVCHSECKSNCTGPAATQCTACAHYKITSTGECVTACPSTGFYKEHLECKPCDPSCDTCQGPLTADCLTCREGLFLMTKGHVCVEKCFDGYYQALSKCEKCDRRCNTCEGRSNNCTSCSGMKVLVDSDCTDGRRKVPHHIWLPESIRSIVVVLVTICIFLLIFIVIVIGLIYAKNNQYLCWSYKYNKLPCSDKESLVGLTRDDLENEDDFSN